MQSKNGTDRYVDPWQDTAADATPDAPQRTKRRAPVKTPYERRQIALDRVDRARQLYDHAVEHDQRYSALQNQIASAIYSQSHVISAERIATIIYRLTRGGSRAEDVLDRLARTIATGNDPNVDPTYDPYSNEYATENERRESQRIGSDIYADPDTDSEYERRDPRASY